MVDVIIIGLVLNRVNRFGVRLLFYFIVFFKGYLFFFRVKEYNYREIKSFFLFKFNIIDE